MLMKSGKSRLGIARRPAAHRAAFRRQPVRGPGTRRLALEVLEDRCLLSYAITDLGTLGGPYSFAYGINNAGQVAGYSYFGERPETHAFLWQGGFMTDLGTLDGGAGSSRAYGINDAGQVVGHSSARGGAAQQAFLWQAAAMTSLGTLGGLSSYAYGINAAGQVVGTSTLASPPGISHAFLWQDGAMTDLGTLGGSSSCAYGINAAGRVVGHSLLAGPS